jgi:hypothetical protein
MTLSSLRVSCDPNTISMLIFTCCNVKYDVIKKILTWRWMVARFVFIYAFIAQVLGDRIHPFFVKNKFPVFFFLFGIFVINLCYIIREISLFHIIREISLFHIREISLFLPVYYPAPATMMTMKWSFYWRI